MVKLKRLRWAVPGLVVALAACAGIGLGAGEQAGTANQAPATPAEAAVAGAAVTPTQPAAATTAPTDTPGPEPAASVTAVETATAVPTAADVVPTEAPAVKVTAGPTEAQAERLASLPSRGPAPELFNQVWLNSEPLKLAGLRGKVVIVEFWTFG